MNKLREARHESLAACPAVCRFHSLGVGGASRARDGRQAEDHLQSKGVTLFALVDHSGEAEKVGVKMPPTKLLIFGNPKGGTPLMLAAPSAAIDLPLKILVAENAQGKVWISYNSAEYLKERHGLAENLLPNIAVVETLAVEAGK
jgi:uncharacterized protein (DUF302 family)